VLKASLLHLPFVWILAVYGRRVAEVPDGDTSIHQCWFFSELEVNVLKFAPWFSLVLLNFVCARACGVCVCVCVGSLFYSVLGGREDHDTLELDR